MLRVREAVDNPPLVVMKDTVMPFADRKVEAKRFHETTVRAHALGRWNRDLVWPAAVNRGGAQLAFSLAHGISPLTLCSHFVLIGNSGSPEVNASEGTEKSAAETATALETEVDEAIASCGGDYARGSARYVDRERVSGGRNRAIDGINLNGIRAGADAQGTSAREQDLLEVGAASNRLKPCTHV